VVQERRRVDDAEQATSHVRQTGVLRVPVGSVEALQNSSHDFSPHNGKHQMPGRRLEARQLLERWQSGWFIFRTIYNMSFCHVKRLEVSFVEGSDSGDIST